MKKSGASQASRHRSSSRKESPNSGRRGETLSRMRKPSRKQPRRRRGVEVDGHPIWSHDGIICTGESYKNVVKLTFAKARL